MKDLISLKFISLEKIKKLFDIIDREDFQVLENKIMGTAFFQPSTRTRLSFETAMLKLGGKVVGFSDMHHSRCYDGYFQETLEDFARVIAQLVDVLVIRHFTKDIPLQLSQIVSIPIINAGDGINEHPTQALQDIWLMRQKAGSLQGKNIAFVGDISRNYRSMVFGLKHFSVKKLMFLLPGDVNIPDDIKVFLNKEAIPYEIYSTLTDILNDADFVNTFTFSLRDLENQSRYVRIMEEYVINHDLYKKTNSHAYILNAGPRTYEVAKDMDNHPKFLFFEQVRIGTLVRKGILSFLLNTSVERFIERKESINEIQ